MTAVSDQALAHLGYRRIEPSASLREFIDCYWFIDAHCRQTSGYTEFLHPDGGSGVILNYGDALSFDRQQKHAGAYLDGTNTRSISLGLAGTINAVGIRFKPAGASVFSNLPLAEIKDQRLELADVKLKHFSHLYEILPAQKNLFDKVTAIEQALMKTRLQDKHISPLTHRAIGMIEHSQGRLTVTELTQHVDIGQRKLERLFRAQLGIRPGELARLVRVEDARRHLKHSAADLAEIAYHLGFYDQAHFSKSFKTVVGLTPGEYRQRAQASSSSDN
jgi:AraC-like DNA-binding protein